MSRITHETAVNVPVRIAYDQWTQFESFPSFMDGIERVVQVDDTTLEWTASIAGKTKQWRAEIVEQRPDSLVAWRSIDGARNDGTVRFEHLNLDRTRVTLEIDVDPEGFVENVGDGLGFVERRVKADLDRFKAFIEDRERPTGAWRGTVEAGRVEDDDRSADASTAETATTGSRGERGR